MKKTYLALTVLAMAALVSCQENEIFNNKPLEKDVVGFYLKESTTKAGSVSAIERGIILPLGNDGMGHSFVLEQTITNLDAMGPETKGTPAYTKNVKDLYGGKFNAAVIGNSITDLSSEFVYDDSYGKYYHKYDFDLWASDNVPVYFYMWMPGDLGDAINGGDAFTAANFDDGKITFTYDGSELLGASADSVLAKDMTDLLFTSRYFEGKGSGTDEYDVKNGAQILFHHVFTGVKFASSTSADDDETIKINEVIFRGLQDKGTCVVTPKDEKGAYKDVSDVYSSKDAAVWTPDASPVSGTSYSTGGFGSDFATYSGDKFPDSFTGAGADRNLNDNDATQTLWIMPQTITAGVKLTIKYTIKRDGKDEDGEWTIDFGEYLSKSSDAEIKLEAGQLHTFYIKIDDVNVQIEDSLATTNETNDTKNGVVITNTGSVDAYIRASIIGQWLDNTESPVFGFYDEITGYKGVDSWYDDQFGTGADTTSRVSHGTFTGLPGYKGGANPNNTSTAFKWQLCPDGFYYYTEVVASGDATAGKLFDSYVVNKNYPKTVRVGSDDVPIHFLLEISTQAVSAKMTAEKDGKTNLTWQKAWERALGYDPEVGPTE